MTGITALGGVARFFTKTSIAAETGEVATHVNWGKIALVGGGVAAVIAGAALLGGCAAAKVDNAVFTGSGGGGMSGNFDITGQKDTGNGAWQIALGRSLGQSVLVTGSTTGNTLNSTARNRSNGSFSNLTGGLAQAGDGSILTASVTGTHMVDDGYTDSNGNHVPIYVPHPISGQVSVHSTGYTTWEGKVDIPWAPDISLSGDTSADGWKVHISRPGFDRSFSGTGEITMAQEVALAIGAETDTSDMTQ